VVTTAELDADPSTGIKNYLAHDGQAWDTSTHYIATSLTRASLQPLAPGLKPFEHRFRQLQSDVRGTTK
jgi:heterokaryon incompatibility protein Het-C